MTDFGDAALILAAHGSSVNPDSGSPAHWHCQSIRRRGLFREVSVAFVQQEPTLAAALRRVFSPRVFVVPLFISDGWFTRHVVPVELGLREVSADTFAPVQRRGSQIVHYCAPVGSHPSMTEVLLGRAREVLAQHPDLPPPDPSCMGLLLAGHGTAYSPGSRQSIERQVDLIRQRRLYREVFGVFLEEPPHIPDAWALGTASDRVLVPFFMSDGLHTREDIPRQLGDADAAVGRKPSAGSADPASGQGSGNEGKRLFRRGPQRLWYARALGTEPLLAEVILERVREATAVAERAG